MEWITNTQSKKSAIFAMYAGLVLTVITMIILYVDHATINVLANHIKTSYPSYSQSRIDSAVMLYLIYLSIIGVMGIISWLNVIWGAKKDKPWTRWAATGMFILGTIIALFNLLVKDTSGDTGLPPLLGLIGLLPCIAGLLVVILIWRTPKA
ncbi:hypothetical protein MK805_12770 [Shimazuella sp. AN120528]|uniref:hypothetical protein n=1 Tax=Shimazuella soli TaxID=1892854 RepID=UPI001F1143EA|nr:hypothetical protein [Shimazuella soli]MCH5585815.1 hypothetical protein [Shimazuella soli]